jgi:hypothetical protein
MKTSFIFACTLILLVSSACAPQASPQPVVNTEIPAPTATTATIAENPIVLGNISNDPAEVIEGAQPGADYLAEQLKDYGISSGEIDLYFDSTYPGGAHRRP